MESAVLLELITMYCVVIRIRYPSSCIMGRLFHCSVTMFLAVFVVYLKSKCLAIKLKCVVGNPEWQWTIGSNRYCALYLTIGFSKYYWSKEGLGVLVF
jgi:hypothetical protein